MKIDYAREIRSLVDMREVVERYGFDVNRSGFINCPFHSEKTNSLKIYPNGRGFCCFGCGAKGSVIDFVMKLFNLNFHEALVKINLDFSLGLPIGDKPTLRQARELQERQRIAEAKKSEREKLIEERQKALDYYVKLDKQRIRYQPKPDDEELNPLFLEAIQNIEGAAQAVSDAESRLYEYENKR